RDLLPLTEHHLAVVKRNRHRWTEQRRAHMARSIVVAPPKVMLVLAVARCELIEHLIHIVQCAGLELNRRQPRCRADDEHGDNPRSEIRFSDRPSNGTRDVMRVSLPLCRTLVRVRRNHQSSALTISSITFLASPNTIMVLSM